MNYIMDDDERADRRDARMTILNAVNGFSERHNPFTMRHLRRAVRIARFNRLVSNEVLVTAGFNPVS